MKDYKQFYDKIINEDFLTIGNNKKNIINWIIFYNQDLPSIERVKVIINKIIELKNIDLAENDQIVKDSIEKWSKVSKKSNVKPIKRIEEFLKKYS